MSRPHPTHEGITTRGVRVLALLVEGEDPKNIARRLGYSQSRVNGILHELRVALGAKNTTQLVAIAMRTGLIK